MRLRPLVQGRRRLCVAQSITPQRVEEAGYFGWCAAVGGRIREANRCRLHLENRWGKQLFCEGLAGYEDIAGLG